MFGKKKQIPQIDKEQLELIQTAQKRIKQKKRLYIHFVLFLIGAVFLILINIVLGIGKDVTFFGNEWFVYAILIWLFLFIYHVFNVFITHKFMGKVWEQKQLDKLVAKQKEQIEKLKQNLPKEKVAIEPNTDPDSYRDQNPVLKSSQSKLTIIAAAAENNAIGLGNKLIWHLGDDLKRFKNLTNGHHIIMGRKTFESFPKPLPNRTHVVISRQKDYQVPEGVIVVSNLQDAIDASKNDPQPFIIGGGEIYRQTMSLANKIELTRVHATFNADAFFPEIDKTVWKETSSKIHSQDENHKYAFSFLTYERK